MLMRIQVYVCVCLSGCLVERIDWMDGWVTENSMVSFLLSLKSFFNSISRLSVYVLASFLANISFLPSFLPCFLSKAFLPIEIIASGSFLTLSLTQSFDDCIAFLMHYTRQIVPRLNFHSLSNFDCLSHLFLVRKITKSPSSLSLVGRGTKRNKEKK